MLIENLHSALGVTLGLPQSSKRMHIEYHLKSHAHKHTDTSTRLFAHKHTHTHRFNQIDFLILKGIHSVQHEISFWMEKSRNASAKSDKEAANVFSMAIDKLNQLLRLMKSHILHSFPAYVL